MVAAYASRAIKKKKNQNQQFCFLHLAFLCSLPFFWHKHCCEHAINLENGSGSKPSISAGLIFNPEHFPILIHYTSSQWTVPVQIRRQKDKNKHLREGLLLPAVMLSVQLKELSKPLNKPWNDILTLPLFIPTEPEALILCICFWFRRGILWAVRSTFTELGLQESIHFLFGWTFCLLILGTEEQQWREVERPPFSSVQYL